MLIICCCFCSFDFWFVCSQFRSIWSSFSHGIWFLRFVKQLGSKQAHKGEGVWPGRDGAGTFMRSFALPLSSLQKTKFLFCSVLVALWWRPRPCFLCSKRSIWCQSLTDRRVSSAENLSMHLQTSCWFCGGDFWILRDFCCSNEVPAIIVR